MAIDRSKFLAKFVDEAREHCSKLNDGLLSLENIANREDTLTADPSFGIRQDDSGKNPDTSGIDSGSAVNSADCCIGDDAEIINSLFRSAHTIKGSARMMKLATIGELAHGIEDLLDAARGRKIRLTNPVFQLLFKSVDNLSDMIDKVTSPEGVPPADADLCAELRRAATCIKPDSSESSASSPSQTFKPVAEQTELHLQKKNPSSSQEIVNHIKKEPSEEYNKTAPENNRPSFKLSDRHDIAVEEKAPQSQYLRINTAKLDDLIRLMGEIISDHNRFKKDIRVLQESSNKMTQCINYLTQIIDMHDITSDELKRASENSRAAQVSLKQTTLKIIDTVIMQSHLMGELQETTLKLCMMPLSTVFEPLRRTVRDMAQEAGKEVVFSVSGGETELDRKIAERIGDSLLHMIRNSLDHGLENPEERVASGKPYKGNISLSAFYDGGGVTITLKDDGRGVDPEKIRSKALAKHLFDTEKISMMSRTEILNIIFLPGFSTSPIITDLSGRGVGMDVVRKNIVDKLKGSISIETSEGEGTSFILRLPLNLAVFPLCMVCVANQTFALPATSVAELCSVSKEDIIEIVGKKAIRVREEIIPLEYLSEILQIKQKDSLNPSSSVIIVKDGANRLGLIVDGIIGKEEMVVKPLPVHLANLKIVTGGTIGRGDSIVTVLHVLELMHLAGKSIVNKAMLHNRSSAEVPLIEARSTTILVVDDSINTREIEKTILEAYGYNVETADDGLSALEKTGSKLYDLVITDVEMPRLNGFALTEQLRSDPRYHNVPIIIVTSLEKDADKKRGIVAGADAYIVKRAFDQSNLLDTVKSLIG